MTTSARILIVGTELLQGGVDANGPTIARSLAARGIPVRGIDVVPDDREALARRFAEAVAEGGVVVATGGLGPTEDDLTREALERATGTRMVDDAESRRRIVLRFARRGVEPNELSLGMARVPEGSEVVANVTGSAPGSVLALPGARAVVVLLPGPPRELAEMIAPALDLACARLCAMGLPIDAPPARAVLVLAGIGESDAALRLKDVDLSRLVVAWLAKPGEVRLSFTGPTARVEAARAAAREALGPHVVSDDGRGLAQVIVLTLAERGETIGVAESCTGGLLAAALTSVPGSSAVVRAGIVAYSNDAKSSIVKVSPDLIGRHGAVSAEVASALAAGARRVASADWGVGVTGIAGPSGGTDEKPVGLVNFCVAAPDGRRLDERRVFGGGREDVREHAVAWALDMVRRML